ncbi:MAG: DNA translocase FtsK 4TM domain-containing protein [Chlorobi bacterium]|nr:DNA translocase FtsK 4TM domain-containing protein [Chlorobiota bacterium]MCI0716312.1 DNA translocase FtsK 4TM domain-containing protein [Chlorobiota bacterium]
MKERQSSRRKDDSSGFSLSGKSSRRKFEEGLPISNKKQILGFFLILFSILIAISITSYSPGDESRLESINISEIFKKENQSSNYNTSNWLGIAGVIISGFFVKGTFGYFSLIMPLLLILFGLNMMRKKSLFELMQFSVYSILLMIFLASLSGVFRASLGTDKIPYSFIGTSGEYFAAVSLALLGLLGSYILLFGLVIVFGFLLLDRDIAKTIARIKFLFESVRDKYRASAQEMKQRREEEKLKESKRLAIQKEREKILKTKMGLSSEGFPEPLIKDTKINRPVENELLSNEGLSGVKTSEKQPNIKVIPFEIENGNPEKEQADYVPDESKTVKKPKFIEKISDDSEDEVLYIPETLDDYKMPSHELLDEPLKEELELISDDELKENGRLLQAKLLNFGVTIEKVVATPGPVVTLYELVPAEDVKLSRIESLQDDIALAMKAKGIRMIIPMPGKGTVGVEIPNHKSVIVKIKSVIGSKKFNDSNLHLPIALGKTISGDVYVDDLTKMPHLLVAGSTGSGKSVGINTIIASLLYKLHPSDLKFLLIDPKKIELNLYSKLKNHYLAVSKDYSENIVTTPQNSVLALKSLEFEMEKRYERLANATVRNIDDYNKKFAEGKLRDDENVKHSKMPYIVVIIDELADLMITAAREVEEPIARLAQLARAVGIHLVLATQRPSVDVITGVIKANFPARIAYLVNSKVDSRTIIDMNGAEQLLGLGDMLYLPPGVGKPVRIQSPFISSEEVEKVTDYISSQKGFSRPYEMPSIAQSKRKSYSDSDERDELFEDAARIIVRYQQGSVSLLQRKLKIGYARAARIVDELEMANIVGPFDGSKAREVLVESEAELEQLI